MADTADQPAFTIYTNITPNTSKKDLTELVVLLQTVLLIRQGANLTFTLPEGAAAAAAPTVETAPTPEAAPAPEATPAAVNGANGAADAAKRPRRTNAQIAADKAAAEQAAADAAAKALADEVAADVAADTPAEEALPEVTADELRTVGAEVLKLHGAQKLVDTLVAVTGQRSIRALVTQAQLQAAMQAFKAALT